MDQAPHIPIPLDRKADDVIIPNYPSIMTPRPPPGNALLYVAVACALLPLTVGVLCFVLWAITSWTRRRSFYDWDRHDPGRDRRVMPADSLCRNRLPSGSGHSSLATHPPPLAHALAAMHQFSDRLRSHGCGVLHR
ncbi:MAG TPA: hypothetical protein VFC46_14130, partial [Humisphaera sp.]|nr:hypothetical protein [Humisphaera sp.]